jgi:NitT/TauT family transport system permease protein
MKKFGKKVWQALYSVLAVIIFLALWEAAARLKILVNPLFLPPFSKIVQTLWGIALKGELWKHLSASLRRAVLGYIFGVAFALPLGLAIGWFKSFGRFLNPLLQVFRNTPVLALLPVFMMFFGITELAKIVVIFWGVIWGVLINTISGVSNVDPVLIRASRSMGSGSLRLFATVVFPGALPHIFTGMRISATTSIIILIAAEMLGASKGLGYALTYYQANMKIPQMYSFIVVLSILGVTLNFVLEFIEKRSFRWRDETGTTIAEKN